MMALTGIEEVAISQKRVFVRVDFNVPLDDQGRITDDARMQAALPTIRHAIANNAVLILASHLGRPKGRPAAEFSLAPVAQRLAELLETPVQMAPDCVGGAVEALVGGLAPGQVVMLENLRFHDGEQKDDDDFARALAKICDVYVNDAFAVCHRKNASVSAITRHVPVCAAGFLLKKELDCFHRTMTDPGRPFAAVIGGAKVSSKLAALRNMLRHVDKVLIGGAMANTFLKSRGVSVGRSRVEQELVDAAGATMAEAAGKQVAFYLPVDAVAAEKMDPDAATCIVPIQEIPDDHMVLDIGPATSLLYEEALENTRTILWNGPMGVFEMAAFRRGTLHMVDSVIRSGATSIVGGGDTDAAIHQSGKIDRFSYISTGGGAFLSLMEGKSLPAVAALEAAGNRNVA
jgi:phosphoglycerate kinase